MIVLDASSVIELLLNTDRGAALASLLADPATSLHAPHLMAVEVAQVLRRFAGSGAIAAEVAAGALADLSDLDVVRYEHEPFLGRVWELRENVTAYDAVYLALAEALGAPLLTCDARLAAAPGHGAEVRVV